MRYDPRHGLLIQVPTSIYLVWHSLRAAPALMVAALWIITAYRFLT